MCACAAQSYNSTYFYFSNTSHFTAEERKKLPVNLDEIMKVN